MDSIRDQYPHIGLNTLQIKWHLKCFEFFLNDQNIIFCSKENETIVLDAKIFLKIIN